MANRDLVHNVKVEPSIVPAVYKAAKEGDAVDTQGYGSAMVVVNVGAITDGSHSVSIEESDTEADGSTWAAVDDADLQGTEPTLSANTAYQVGYVGSKRYIRATGASSGDTGAAFGAVVVLGNPTHAPVE